MSKIIRLLVLLVLVLILLVFMLAMLEASLPVVYYTPSFVHTG